jgi:hypothetical protein
MIDTHHRDGAKRHAQKLVLQFECYINCYSDVGRDRNVDQTIAPRSNSQMGFISVVTFCAHSDWMNTVCALIR